jgi:hypothetical protein
MANHIHSRQNEYWRTLDYKSLPTMFNSNLDFQSDNKQ